MANNLKGCLAKHEVLPVGEGLGWCNNNGITSMDTERIKVLHLLEEKGDGKSEIWNIGTCYSPPLIENTTHIANRDAVVARISDNLVLQFFPPSQILINQDFIKDSKMSVAQYVKTLGKDVNVVDFKRVALG